MKHTNLPLEIIHIEDDSSWSDEIREYLYQNSGLNIKNYTSATSIETLKRLSEIEGPCIVIVDLRLGGDSWNYDGYHWLLEELRIFVQHNPQTDVFVLSGQLNEGIIATLNRRGIPPSHIFSKGNWAETRSYFLKALRDATYMIGRREPKKAISKRMQYRRDAFGKYTNAMISILFLAADPTDESSLRLGEELREIQEKLQLAAGRENFNLIQRMSVRPADISQSLLDIQPQIVHFSGHGTHEGALCFENQVGKAQPIEPVALAALFEQFADEVMCVILNACYSERQAKEISKHISYVIGMSREIGDGAAIAFAIGFYQALGAGRSIEKAYKLGCVQIRLWGIPEHLTPILLKRE